MSHSKDSKPGVLRACVLFCRKAVVAAAAGLIILAAVVVGVGRLLIPYADEARPWLEALLSERLGQPIEIGAVEARWPRVTPQIILTDIRAGDGDVPLATANKARLELYLPNLFRSRRNPLRLVVLGLDLVLAEDESGRWGVRLEGGGELGGSDFAGRPLAGDLTVRDVAVHIAPYKQASIEFHLVDGTIRRLGDQTYLSGRLHPADNPASVVDLRLLARHPGGRVTGLKAWSEIRKLDLATFPGADWLPDAVRDADYRLAAELWLDWTTAAGSDLDVRFSASAGGGESVDGRLHVLRRAGRTDAQVSALEVDGRQILSGLTIANRGNQWAAAVDRLAFDGLHALLEPWMDAFSWWPHRLGGHGEDVFVHYERGRGLHRLGGRIRELAAELRGDRPAVSGLDVDLALSGDRAVFGLSGAPAIDWPDMIRQRVQLDGIGGRVLLAPDSVQLDGVSVTHERVDARADGWVWLGDDRPFLDFHITADRIAGGDPRPFLPHGRIPPKAMEWLDRSLLRAGGTGGGLNYHFRLGHKLADWQSGDFQAWVDFTDAHLDYWPGWPQAESMSGRVDFVGSGLFGRVERGRVGDLEVAVEQVVIPDLTEPELSLLIMADDAEAEAVQALVGAFPLPGWQNVLAPMQWRGPVSVATELMLPIRRMADWNLNGEISLHGTDFSLPEAGLGFRELQGAASFDRKGIDPAVLHAAVGAGRSAIELSADFRPPTKLHLAGELHPADVIISQGPVARLGDYFSGAAHWAADVNGGERGGLELSLRSNLEGLASTLPAPLGKSAGEESPLGLDVRLIEERVEARASLDDRLKLVLRGSPGTWSTAIGVNQGAPGLPQEPGFNVAGSVAQLDLGSWLDVVGDFAQAMPAGAGIGTGRVQLRLERLLFGGVSLQGVKMSLLRDAAAWRAELEGESIDGSITVPIPLDSGRVVAVDLNRLHLHEVFGDSDAAELENQPVPEQTSTSRPADFPPLHLLIEDLIYRGVTLGRTRVETHSRRDGMEIERVHIDGPVLNLEGFGRWIDSESGPITQFEGRLLTGSLSALLAAFEFESGIAAAESQVDLGGRWPGAPGDFALARVNGTLRVRMTDGSIPEARPGAGRLLGLVSLSTIPRRLLLDFRDVFSQGLAFDSVEGDFVLEGGSATTGGLLIDSPAARITVTGVTDMVARTYDQRLLVEPGVGGALPLIGVLAGGPAGAAAGLVLRTLLEEPLRGITEARYAVTGSWEDPVVELVEARIADEAGEDEIIAPDAPPD